MCAIAGILGGEPLSEEARERMQKTMRRRGPDRDGSYQNGDVTLLHSRLAVIDLTGGSQPMKEQGCVLVYNGELYNTEELRDALTRLGHRFHGHSDTEVVLHAYLQWGRFCVDRMNGIYAFAVYDEASGRLFLARDRIGVKPLFYTIRGNRFLFASEIKTLLAAPHVPAELTQEGVAEILLLGPGRTPGCGVFKDILELEPGCRAVYENHQLHTERYWHLTDHLHEDSPEQTLEQVGSLVTDAIRRQLVSDVPICTFLSGGLDSSLISAVAAHYTDGPLTTFSVDYRDNAKYFQAGKFQPSSDPEYIRLMANYLGSDHHWVILDTVELADALHEAVEARDLPGMADVDASLLLLCRAIKPYATVALSGECADEIFGGYPWYRDPEIRAREGFPWAQSTAWRAGFLGASYKDRIRAEDFVNERYAQTVLEADCLSGLPESEKRLREMVTLNFRWFMQTLLDRKDRMSMWSGLEVRVPFCDHRIAEYLYSIPWVMKDWSGCEKGLLRKAMGKWLPEEVLWRKKSPYPKTHNPSYLQEVSRRLRRVLADPDSPLLQIADRNALEQLLTAQYPWPWYGQLMNTPQTIAYMLQIDHWMKTYQISLV